MSKRKPKVSRIPLKPLREASGGEKHRWQTKPYLVFDVESQGWTKFIVGGTFDGVMFRYHRTLEDVVDYLFKCHSGWDVYSHFGGRFDFLFVLSYVVRANEIAIEPMIPRGSGILSFTLKRDDAKITFRDSSALLPFSLKRITESFGVTHAKKEIDYSKITKITGELLTYLEYDCRGLYESLQKFWSWDLISKAGGASTLASQAVKVLQTTLKEEIPSCPRQVDKHVRRAYLGGRTEIFRPVYRSSEPLFCYDVNSLYPFVMRENDYPGRFDGISNDYEASRLGFWKCKVEVPRSFYLPPLGIIDKAGKFIFPTGCFQGIFTVAEIEYARSLGVVVIPQKGWVFRTAGKIFEKFVDTLYSLKEKSERDSVDYTVAKLLLNSCYGRFGLDPDDKEEIILDDDSGKVRPLEEIFVNGQVIRFAMREKSFTAFTNVAIAAYVTSYARIHMHKIMSEVKDEIYYTDTDSIFTTRRLPCSDRLGELKLEYETNNAVFLLPKTYVVDRKVAMKGFDKKKIQHFTTDDFLEYLEGEHRISVVHDEKFATFKTALRKGNLLTLLPKASKTLRSQYDKRKITRLSKYEYDTLPIHIGKKNGKASRMEKEKHTSRQTQ